MLSSKQDLIEEGHTNSVPQDDVDKFVNEQNLNGYVRTSSKTGLNVEKTFTQIAELMIEKNINKNA